MTVQYTGAIWATGTVFDQSWGGGGPTTFPISGLITGFTQGLVGQTVGSQVVIVIPPGELGYEGGNDHGRHQRHRHPGLRRRHHRVGIAPPA